MRSFSNQGVMDLVVELMLLRRPQARGQYQAVQVIKARHVAELEQVKVDFTILENVKLVHICLLYTSPSPRDGLLSRMPSSA